MSESGTRIEAFSPAPDDAKCKQRSTYSRLLHEMQFRATRNALMNYHEVGKLQDKSSYYLFFANALTAATASGLLVGIAQKGKVLASKAGLAGVVGLPISGVLQLLGNHTSELVPSYKEQAKMHVKAAAAWVSLAETARTERLRIKVEPARDIRDTAAVYNRLIELRVQASSKILISQETHRYFSEHPEIVCDAVKRRGDAYAQFVALEKTQLPSTTDSDQREPVEVIYF